METLNRMPVNKNALLRYRIIDACLTNTLHRYPTMDYILDKMEEQLGQSISESQFNKDIQQMKRIYNAPIKYDRTHAGYCYTEAEFSIREFPLTHAEIDALDYSTALLQQLKGTRMFQQFENAINKVIEGYRASKVPGVSQGEFLQVEEPVRTEGSQWLEVILQAIVNKQALAVRYQPFGRDEKLHVLSPYLLKEYRNRWYVVGHSRIAGNVRVLALDRIRGIDNADEKFFTDNNFSPEDFFRYSFGITQVHGARPEKVVLSFSGVEAPYILSQPLHHSQRIVSQSDDELVVELEVYITTELEMCILSYGQKVKVLQPETLRRDIGKAIGATAALYE